MGELTLKPGGHATYHDLMGEARGHHFISQCYLKRFTHNGSKKSKFWVMDLHTGRSFSTAPANVAKQRDFNAVEGLPAGELENRLGAFEGEVNKALDVIERTKNLEDIDAWVYVLSLASLFAVRNPSMREGMRKSHHRLTRRIMDIALASPERWEAQILKATSCGSISANHGTSYEQTKEFYERGDYSIEVPNALHINTEFHVFEPVLRTMVDRKWSLLIAPPDSGGFLTSDHPVCLVNSCREPSTLARPLGFGLTETTVIFPVTRDLVAVGTFEEGDKVVKVAHEHVAQINGIVLRYAERQVYAANNRVSVKMNAAEPTVRGDDIWRYVPKFTKKMQPSSLRSKGNHDLST